MIAAGLAVRKADLADAITHTPLLRCFQGLLRKSIGGFHERQTLNIFQHHINDILILMDMNDVILNFNILNRFVIIFKIVDVFKCI